MDEAGGAELSQLVLVSQLRERKAQARCRRARQAMVALDQTCSQCQATLDALEQMQAAARMRLLRRLQQGDTVLYLQRLIDTTEYRWRREQQAYALAQERRRIGLTEVHLAAKALAASEERSSIYAGMLADWNAARLDAEDED